MPTPRKPVDLIISDITPNGPATFPFLILLMNSLRDRCQISPPILTNLTKLINFHYPEIIRKT